MVAALTEGRLASLPRSLSRMTIGLSRPQKGSDELRRRGLLAVPAQGVHQGGRLFRRCARPADRRHRQYVERLQSLPRQRAAADRGGQARRDAVRRAADGVSDHQHPRILRPSDQHGAAQSDGHGHRGNGAGAADGCGRRGRRLRQDAAGADHGRRQRRPADGRGSGRTDDRRAPQGRDARRLHRLPPAVVGAIAPATSTMPRSNWSTAGWRRRSAPAW